MRLGMFRCGDRNKAASAVRVMSGLLASASKDGAAAFGELTWPGSTA